MIVEILFPTTLDSKNLYALVVKNKNKDKLQNLDWVNGVTLESTVEFLRAMIYSSTEHFRLIYVDGIMVGCVTMRDKGDALQIGYWLDIDWRKKGVMSRAVAKMLVEANKPVFARVKVENVDSRRVLENNGFLPTVEKDGKWILYWRNFNE